MLIEVACCTQFLGNVADVAKMEGKNIEAVHFPFTQPFGAQRVMTDASASSSSGAKANATPTDASTKPQTVREEVTAKPTTSMCALNAFAAGLPRCPVPGDLFRTRPQGRGAEGGKLPKCRAYIMGSSQQLEMIAEIPHNTVIGPCTELQSFMNAGSGTVSVKVPLNVHAFGCEQGTMVWVHLTSGHDALAHLVDVALPTEVTVHSDAETNIVSMTMLMRQLPRAVRLNRSLLHRMCLQWQAQLFLTLIGS